MSKKNWIVLALANLVAVLLLLSFLWPQATAPEASPPTVVIGSPPPVHTPEAPKPGSTPVEALASTLDPICDMTVEPATASATTVYEGKTYGFCSSYCKAEFEKDPAKYIAKIAAAERAKK